MIKLPVYQKVSANFKYRIELELKSVELQLIYNIRNGFFHFDFTDGDGTKLTGIKVVTGWPLMHIHKAFVNFDGDFMILRADLNSNELLTYDNLGSVFNLYYLTAQEIKDWGALHGL